MNSSVLVNILRFFLLILFQVTVFNNIDFLGYIDPYVYVMFIVLLPVSLSRAQVLIFSFLIGLCIDLFADSGGVNAAACTVIAYLRPVIMRASFGLEYDYKTLKFQSSSFRERLTYVSIMVGIHHLVLFSLEIFNFFHILSILKRTLFSGIFSVVLILLIMALFGKKKKRS